MAMRVIFFSISTFPDISAAVNRTYCRANLLVSQGFKVDIVAPMLQKNKSPSNKRYRILRHLGYFFIALKQAFKYKKVDVVVGSTPNLIVAFTAYCYAKLKCCKFVLEVADPWPEALIGSGVIRPHGLLAYLMKKLSIFLYKRADSIVALSEGIKRNIDALLKNENKTYVILNGSDAGLRPVTCNADLYQTIFHQAKKNLTLGYIGMMTASQDLLVLLKQLSKQLTVKMDLLFLGEGEAYSQIKEYTFPSSSINFCLHPSIARDALPAYWGLCDLALLPLKPDKNLAYAIPSKLFELAGLGKPILLIGPVGEASKLVTQYKLGLALTWDDLKDLNKHLETFIQSPEKLLAMSQACFEFSKKYSRVRQVKAWEQVLSN